MMSLSRVRRLVSAGAAALILVSPAALSAQFTEPPPPAAYALEGVTLLYPDGSRGENIDIVIRGDFIQSIGQNLQIPADAEVLEGTALVVAPGLIDAAGSVEFEFPEVERDNEPVPGWAPPRSAQNFQPHRRVVDHLTTTGEDLADLRKQGVVALAVHPDGPVMPGRGTVLVARKDADTPRELVAIPELGPVMSFRGSWGVYPGTLFGVIAFMRQEFLNVENHAAATVAYGNGTPNVEAPGWDPDYGVLRDVLAGNVPAYFDADDAEDIRRVLDLAEEFGFRPVIVGGEEAWKVAGALRERGVPVLVSLDFPEPERWDPDEGEEEEEEEEGFLTPEGELDAAAQAEKERVEDSYANAGRLAAEGVTFALTSGGGEAGLLEGARKAIEYGLSPAAALAALTATPAQITGVPELARLEEGRAANLVVLDADPFDEDARVLYTFVEGDLERGADPEDEEEEEDEDEIDEDEAEDDPPADHPHGAMPEGSR